MMTEDGVFGVIEQEVFCSQALNIRLRVKFTELNTTLTHISIDMTNLNEKIYLIHG